MNASQRKAMPAETVRHAAAVDPAAGGVVHTLRRAGYEAFLCGGCVRDMLLGRTAEDWDVTTSARPEEVEALFEKTVPVGRAFGVILVLEQDRKIEVATFRADSPAGDGRRPASVRFCGPREDVLRRDFTVNGLLYDPDTAEVIDYVGGRADLDRKLVRTIGAPADRFREDHLRLLRAVRFAAKLDFDLEAATRRAVAGMAALVRLVAAERTAEELERMLASGRAGAALRLMEETRLLLHALPEVAALRGVPQPEAFHPEGDVFEHTALMLDDLPAGCDARLAWAALLHDVGKPRTLRVTDRERFDRHDEVGAQISATLLRRLRRSAALVDAVVALVRGHMRFTALADMREAKRRRTLRDPLFALHLELHRLDCQASHRKLDVYAYARRAWEQEQARPEPAEPLLRGQDLIDMGYAPGPRFARILEAVEDARLEDRVRTADEARAFVRQRFPLDAGAPPAQPADEDTKP